VLPFLLQASAPKHPRSKAQESLQEPAPPAPLLALLVRHQEVVTNPGLRVRTHNRMPTSNAPVLCSCGVRVPLRSGGRPRGGPRGSPTALAEPAGESARGRPLTLPR